VDHEKEKASTLVILLPSAAINRARSSNLEAFCSSCWRRMYTF